MLAKISQAWYKSLLAKVGNPMDEQNRGSLGGKARAVKLSSEERSAIASVAANKRWKRDPELTFLAVAASSLSAMEPDARKRVLVYLKAKFLAEWPGEND
jgi:hypothetical protein